MDTLADKDMAMQDPPAIKKFKFNDDPRNLDAITIDLEILWMEECINEPALRLLARAIKCDDSRAQFVNDIICMVQDVEASGHPLDKARANQVILSNLHQRLCPGVEDTV